MKKLLIIVFACYAFIGKSQNTDNKYHFYVDMNNVKDDRLKVELTVPKIEKEKINYYLPAIVPGTYEVYDFGQYVSDFKAFDKEGNALSVAHPDDNTWEISGADKLSKIEYWVDDTWDAKGVENFVFEPGGTNIEEGENFVFNNHGFFGYFENMKKVPYELTFKKPKGFYGSTGLNDIKIGEDSDVYNVPNYMDLVDSPIMYSLPDTTLLNVGGTDVLVAVYTKKNAVSSKEIAKDVKATLEGQKDYLGGKLPVDKYAFIIYLYSGQSGSGGAGALEHSYSSFYYLPEMPAARLSGIIIDVAAHEFFHIVTPLTIHSEEIGDFEYNNPKMSKHLWLYEGCTEYFAGHFQVTQGLIDKDEYLKIIASKVRGSKFFNDTLPFTVMSKGVLDKYKKEYANVYQKGALIGLCLDIRIRELTNGKMGLSDLMKKLSEEYGINKSFKDDELFDKIAEIVGSEIKPFFNDYVAGNKPLPIKEYLNKVGIIYANDTIVKELTLGGIAIGISNDNKIKVADIGNMNEVGKALGYKMNDVIVAINDKEVTPDNYKTVLDELNKTLKEGDKFYVTVLRKKKGKEKSYVLKTTVKRIERTRKPFIVFNPNATEQQLKLQSQWLSKH
ncbi:MAG: peptidase M61 [Vicingaceae bacterium]